MSPARKPRASQTDGGHRAAALGEAPEAGADGKRLPLQLPLFGILTLCCSCSRLQLRGRWTGRVVHASDYPDTQFSHGICPSCLKKLYPEIAKRRSQRRTAGPTAPPRSPRR